MGLSIAHGIGIPFQKSSQSWSQYCPTQLKISSDVYTEEMDNTTGWSGLNATIAQNTTQKYSGTGSIKLTSNAGANFSVGKNVTWDLSATQGGTVRFWVYPHDDALDKITGISILCAANSTTWWTNYYGGVYATFGSMTPNTWNLVQMTSWIKNGDVDWSSIGHVRIKGVAKPGESPEFSFDLLQAGRVSKPAVVICFDDNLDNTYTVAYPLIKSKNMRASVYVTSSWHNEANHMTTAQLQELNNNGWVIGNHSATHPDFTTLTEAQILTELQTCEALLTGIGLSANTKHVAYPGGKYDVDTLAAMVTYGAKTGRSVDQIISDYDYLYPYELNAWAVAATQSVNTIKAFIDTIILNNAVGILLFHGLVESGATNYQWTIANFTEIINYIETLGLQTLTIDEYYRINSDAITVYHK